MDVRDTISYFETLRTRIENVPEVVEALVFQYQDVLLSLNRDQMLLGRNTDGELFTPDYLSDPYFKTKEQAVVYANMKYALEGIHRQRLSTAINYPDKPKNTPNLIVTGPFQDQMFITAGADHFTIGSRYREADDIERKYENKVFGLAPLSKEYFYLGFLKLSIWRYINGLSWGVNV